MEALAWAVIDYFTLGLRRGFLAKPSGSELPVDRTEDRASKGPRKGFLLSSKKEENGATEKKKDEGGGGRRMTEEASPPHKSSKIYNKCSADNPPFSSSGLEPTGIPVSSCGGCRGVVYVSSTYHYKVLCLENCTMDLHSECLTILLRRQDIGSIDELKIHPALVYSFMDLDTVSGELSNEKKLCPNHPPEPLGPHGAVQVKESKPTMYAMEELLEPSLARSVENPSDAVFEGLRCLYSMDECRPAASPEDNKSSGFFGGLRRGFLAKRSESQVRVDSTEDRAPIKCSADNTPFSPSGPVSAGGLAFTCALCREVEYINSTYMYTVLCSENCTMELHSECLTKLLRRQNIGSIAELKTACVGKHKIMKVRDAVKSPTPIWSTYEQRQNIHIQRNTQRLTIPWKTEL
ncbi:unnamed protein product [Nippostrongylus brasiliensis]|uniref:Uncharacterized protein n=1 Tax=Nippostrongylus brasiliensis TaxID=27835 RepID=A0A158QY11_NIPBR|nr:unnamed protein product [Nippostrongylus brasiliensis]